MKILTLIIKQKYFYAILAGRKVQEFREVRPTTYAKYIEIDEEGYGKLDEQNNEVAIKYDAIRFYVGYNKNRSTALVEVKDAYTRILVDETDTPIEYEYKGQKWIAEEVVYDLGRIIEYDTKK